MQKNLLEIGKFIGWIACFLGGFASFLQWLGIKPKDMAMIQSISLPHVLWLVMAMVLFAIGISSAVYSGVIQRRQIKRLKTDISYANTVAAFAKGEETLAEAALTFARKLNLLRKSYPAPAKTDYKYDEQQEKFPTAFEVHAWRDAKQEIDTKLKAKYFLTYREEAMKFYHRFVDAGISDLRMGALADTLKTSEELKELIDAFRSGAFELEDK